MSEPATLKIGGVAAVLAASVCCAALFLVAALASLSFTAWLANAYYVVIPACCDPISVNKAPNHE